MNAIEYQGTNIYRWNCGSSTFLACPEKGARLMNWHVTMADDTVRDVIHWPESANMNRIEKVRGGNPILFPFCGRTFDQGIIYKWKAKDGERRDMPMHGFARDHQFKIQDVDDYGFTASLIQTAEMMEYYPYQYDFTVQYRFHELALSVALRLENLGDVAIPWSAGHHFYFYLPWAGGSREDYALDVPTNKGYTQGMDGKLMAAEDMEFPIAFSDSKLQDRIHTHLKGDTVRFGLRDGDDNIQIKFLSPITENSMDTIVTWTESDESPFFCVEPWMSPPNSPESAIGPCYVQPGRAQDFSIEVSIA
jgi:galactose mutarotase-like enzyme